MTIPKKSTYFFIVLGIGLGVAISSVAFATWRATTIQWCGPDEINCDREWVSALSGWAGAAAGFVAVIYLSFQIRETDRQNRYANTVNLWSKRALAKRCSYRAKTCSGLMDNVLLITGVARMPQDFVGYVSQIETALRDVSSFVSDPAFALFEGQIESPSNHIDLLQQTISALNERIHRSLDGLPAPASIGSLGIDVDTNCRLVRFYMDEIGKLADKFIEATDAMV